MDRLSGIAYCVRAVIESLSHRSQFGLSGLEGMTLWHRMNLTLGAIYPDDMWIDYDINRMLDEFRKFLP